MATMAHVTIKIDTSKFQAEMKRTTDALSRLDWTRINRTLAQIAARRRDYERRRARNFARPTPLCIDGHEYARRRRGRR